MKLRPIIPCLVLAGACLAACTASDAESDRQIVDRMLQNMVLVEGGTFTMGTDAAGSDTDERPAHQVTVSDFYIGRYEVTQKEWRALMNLCYEPEARSLRHPIQYVKALISDHWYRNPSHFKGDDRPVDNVSWQNAMLFLFYLNRLTGGHYRFPTEAEWEFAARGGNKGKGCLYAGSDNLDEVAWYHGNSGQKTHPVGSKKPNELGLYDMSGNVYEWCQDWFDDYKPGDQDDPQGGEGGSSRSWRGGGFEYEANTCRAAYRGYAVSTYRSHQSGFRLARPAKDPEEISETLNDSIQ